MFVIGLGCWGEGETDSGMQIIWIFHAGLNLFLKIISIMAADALHVICSQGINTVR